MEKKQPKKSTGRKNVMHDGEGQRGADLLKWSDRMLKKAAAESKKKKK